MCVLDLIQPRFKFTSRSNESLFRRFGKKPKSGVEFRHSVYYISKIVQCVGDGVSQH